MTSNATMKITGRVAAAGGYLWLFHLDWELWGAVGLVVIGSKVWSDNE